MFAEYIKSILFLRVIYFAKLVFQYFGKILYPFLIVIFAKFMHGSTPITLFLSKLPRKAPSLLPISKRILGLNFFLNELLIF